jgi:hypothetical protein
MRLVLVLALIVVTVATPLAAQAADVRASFGPTNDRLPAPARTPPAIVGGNPHIQSFEDRRRGRQDRPGVFVPQVVFVSPGRCWQSGYWSYQWVPQSYSYSTYVPGVWSPDGTWIPAHYEPGWYNGGYYQPLWVEGYWSDCQ